MAASWAYRVIAPKAGVGTVGPIYLYEIVPLLALLAADGLLRLSAPRALGRTRLLAALLSTAVVSATLFVPPRLADLARAAGAGHELGRQLEARRISHALVFVQTAVPWQVGLSWAYFARYNSPALDDDVLFVRPQPDRQANLEFWRRRYPDRSAWEYIWMPDGPHLRPLGDQ